MSGLGFNKVAGAFLATGLAVVGLGIASEMIFHQDPPARPGWRIAVAEAEAGAGGPQAEGPIDWGTVLPAANVAAGTELHRRCISCHNFDNGGPNGIGPNLWGIVNRPTASHAGFDYSPAMRAHAAASPTWTYDELAAFIRNPQQHVSGTRMTYTGLRPQQDRINLIAFLRTLAAAPAPIPAPDPARAPGAAAGGAAASGPGAAASGSASGSGAATAGSEQNPAAEGSSAQGPAARGAQPAQPAGGPVNQTPSSGAAQAPSAQTNVNPGDQRDH